MAQRAEIGMQRSSGCGGVSRGGRGRNISFVMTYITSSCIAPPGSGSTSSTGEKLTVVGPPSPMRSDYKGFDEDYPANGCRHARAVLQSSSTNMIDFTLAQPSCLNSHATVGSFEPARPGDGLSWRLTYPVLCGPERASSVKELGH